MPKNYPDLLVQHITASIAICDANTKAVADRTAQLEAEGHRIVTHFLDATNGDWEILDAKTDEILVSGNGMDEYHEKWQDKWWHEDSINEEVLNLDIPETKGLPADLAEQITEWVENNEDKARALLKVLEDEAA